MDVREAFNAEPYPEPAVSRPATLEELKVYMEYCPNAKQNQDIYVSEGRIDHVNNKGRVTGAAPGRFGITIKQPEYYIDFGNNQIRSVAYSCVLCNLDIKLDAYTKKGDLCKLFWSRSNKGLSLQFVTVNDATSKMEIVTCRMCNECQRQIDLIDGYKCMYCGNKYNPTFMEMIKTSIKKK